LDTEKPTETEHLEHQPARAPLRGGQTPHPGRGPSPMTRRSPPWWVRCCWSRTSTGSSRTGACSRP